MNDCIYPLALSMAFGPNKCRRILSSCDTPEKFQARGLAPDHWQRLMIEAEAKLNEQEAMGIHSASWLSAEYPVLLKEVADPPAVLHYQGQLPTSEPCLAVVGTRRPTGQGQLNTAFWVEALAGIKVCIVSGLAMGVDAEAHRAALRSGLPTVAVLAHGLDSIHPVKHTGLAREIVAAGGALISEHAVGQAPTKCAFPQRNRIIAGMSLATLVIEAAIKSGAGITASMAFQYHRDVFAIPGRPHDVMSQGCLDLVARQIASMCVHPTQMIESLGLRQSAHQAQRADDSDPVIHQVVDALQSGGCRLTDLSKKTELSEEDCLAALGELIWQGRIHVQQSVYALRQGT